MACPSETALSDFVSRTLPGPVEAELAVHVADCDGCRNLVFALASPVAGAAADEAVEPVERIGRFVVTELVGHGAMGSVYRARDPELDRAVAIKVRRGRSRLDGELEDRLRREAQALARLSHPHVVAVYEAGGHDGRPYVAMEYVEGTTLEAWLAGSRTTRAVLDCVVQAGRGLAAAHAVGLVPRDFKPANVLVSTTGEAKVGDFGLVRLDAGEPVRDRDAPGDGDVVLTMTGSLLGTPAYMAPEQLDGEVATAASDQFSFCVTLCEALFGRRPFAGATLDELRAAMARPLELPADARWPGRVPAAVRRALARGLARDPAARFASMAALVDALTRAPRRRAVVRATRSSRSTSARPPRSPGAAICSGRRCSRRATPSRCRGSSAAPTTSGSSTRTATSASSTRWIYVRTTRCGGSTTSSSPPACSERAGAAAGPVPRRRQPGAVPRSPAVAAAHPRARGSPRAVRDVPRAGVRARRAQPGSVVAAAAAGLELAAVLLGLDPALLAAAARLGRAARGRPEQGRAHDR
ncbi:MAG TPA: serine/threonine-protein kinase, partial [Kofleriaceae bacterium]|nr:serine/threonine-protein kinase [Kofleriaceae bacterium]